MKHHSFTAVLFSIALLAATSGEVSAKPPPPDVGPGRVAWFDLTASDLSQSKNFYGKLFAWTFEPVKGTDRAFEIVAGGTGIGTLRSADGKIGSYNGVVYIQVNDLEKSCQDAKELGGTIPDGFPFNLPEGRGAIALVIDPAGHPVGMYSRTPVSRQPHRRNKNPLGCSPEIPNPRTQIPGKSRRERIQKCPHWRRPAFRPLGGAAAFPPSARGRRAHNASRRRCGLGAGSIYYFIAGNRVSPSCRPKAWLRQAQGNALGVEQSRVLALKGPFKTPQIDWVGYSPKKPQIPKTKSQVNQDNPTTKTRPPRGRFGIFPI